MRYAFAVHATWLLALVSLVGLAGAAPPTSAPKIPVAPPELGVVTAVDAQSIELHYYATNVVKAPPTEVTATTLGQGTLEYPVTEARAGRVELARVVARRVDGTAVAKEDFAKLFAAPTAVVVVKPGQAIDPIWLAALKPETVVLELPALAPTTVARPQTPPARQAAPATNQPTIPGTNQPVPAVPRGSAIDE